MSTIERWTLHCDAPGPKGQRAKGCAARVEGEPGELPIDLRETARELGWEVSGEHGRGYDFCPEHVTPEAVRLAGQEG